MKLSSVKNYILDQEQHHAKQNFNGEYLDFLIKFEIEHNEKYLLKGLNNHGYLSNELFRFAMIK